MRKFDLASVEDCERIFAHKDTVILSGKNPWIFRKDGTYIAKLKKIRNSYDMVFLPDNMVLMDGKVDLAYHYVSLDTGEIIWSFPKKGKRDGITNEFAVSPDGEFVYYVYEIKNILHVDQLFPRKQLCNTYTIPLGMRATWDCACDADGNLLLLQSFLVHNYMEDGTDNSHHFQGILKWSPSNPEPTWVYECKRGNGPRTTLCACNDKYVLYDDFTVVSIRDGEEYNLLQNNPAINRAPGGFVVSNYDPERSLLTVVFLYSWSTIIIDCKSRRIVAHYTPISRGLSDGCLIDDEFWIGTYDGVIKRPFPHMDEYPRKL